MSKELTRESIENLLIVGDVPYGNAHQLVRDHDAAQRATIQQQAEKIEEQARQIEELLRREEVAVWYETLVSRACIGTKETPSLKAYIQQLEARVVQLETDVDRMAWKTSPATAQATIDQLVKRNEQLEARVKELEEESRQWEKGSLVALLRDNAALKAKLAEWQSEA